MDRAPSPMPAAVTPPAPAAAAAQREATQRWRLVVRRRPDAPELPQKGSLDAWEQSLRDSGLPLAGMDARPPKPRFALAAVLPAAMAAEAELVDAYLVRRLARWMVRDALEASMPTGHTLVDLYDVWLGEPSLPGSVEASVYRATVRCGEGAMARARAAAGEMVAAPALPRTRRKGDRDVAYDLRPLLAGLDVIDGDALGGLALRMNLRHDPEKGIGRPDEVLWELAARIGEPLEAVEMVRERLVLRERRPSLEPGRGSTPAGVPPHGPRRPAGPP